MQSVVKIFATVILLSAVVSFEGCLQIDVDGLKFNAKCTSDCTVIKGKFTTEDIELPVENLELKLTWRQHCGISACWFGSADRDIASFKTDVAGNYIFKFYAREYELTGGYFEVSFALPDNSYTDNGSSFSVENLMIRNAEIVYDYLLPQKGQVELILKNPTDISDSDLLGCQVFYEYGDGTRSEWGEALQSGTSNNTVLSEAAGNQTNYVRVYKKKGGIETVTIDTIYVQKQATYKYEIQF